MTLYEQLYKPFKAHEHEWNFQGHIYVSVNPTIQRLNELTYTGGESLAWSWESKHFSTAISPNTTKKGDPQYDAFCVGELTIPGLGTRMGTGADTNADLDTAAKSAQAYGFRKGANLFGVAMYLLRNPKAESEFIKFLVNNDPDDSDAMKEAVITLMTKIKRIDASAANLVSTFGISLDELKNDPEVFRRILEQENRV